MRKAIRNAPHHFPFLTWKECFGLTWCPRLSEQWFLKHSLIYTIQIYLSCISVVVIVIAIYDGAFESMWELSYRVQKHAWQSILLLSTEWSTTKHPSGLLISWNMCGTSCNRCGTSSMFHRLCGNIRNLSYFFRVFRNISRYKVKN